MSYVMKLPQNLNDSVLCIHSFRYSAFLSRSQVILLFDFGLFVEFYFHITRPPMGTFFAMFCVLRVLFKQRAPTLKVK